VVPVAPVTVSHLTCLSVLGIDERRFLELLVPHCHGVARLGRLRLVPIEEALRTLATLSTEVPSGAEPAAAPATDSRTDEERWMDGDFTSAEDVARALGPEMHERWKRARRILDEVAARHAADHPRNHCRLGGAKTAA